MRLLIGELRQGALAGVMVVTARRGGLIAGYEGEAWVWAALGLGAAA